MSLRKFMALFPDEQACRDYLFAVRWPRGFICTKCGESKYCLIKTRNVYECAHCKTQTSITSN
ncbi:transposase, partial [Cohnella hongkongensis]